MKVIISLSFAFVKEFGKIGDYFLSWKDVTIRGEIRWIRDGANCFNRHAIKLIISKLIARKLEIIFRIL